MNKKSPLFFTIAGIFIASSAQIINYTLGLSDIAFGLFMGVGIGLLLVPIIKKIKISI
jgi:hypothetical protein